MRAGLYVHFPFCASKCPYCHFYSVAWSEAGYRTWRSGLEREAGVAVSAAQGLRFDTLYMGGGSPSLLGPEEVARIRDLSLDHFPLEIREWTLEANPVAAGGGLLRGWWEAGVTRLSVGVQSFDDPVLRSLGRPYSAEEARSFCGAARQSGYDVLAVDMMIGVPGQTLRAVERSVETLLELRPDHVSLYFLENVEGLPFAKVLARRPVDEDAAVDHFERTKQALESDGLLQYEISNFARAGKQCRHNLKYWRYEPFIGLGPSACSHAGGRRWCNESSLETWADRLGREGTAEREVVRLDAGLAVREALASGLRLVEGVDLAALSRSSGIDVASLYAREIDGLVAEGLLMRAAGRLRIPAGKLLISNAVLSRLI